MGDDRKAGAQPIIKALDYLETGTVLQGFDRETAARGRAYAWRGQVAEVALTNSGTVLTAEVIGTAPRPYEVEVTAHGTGWRVQFVGRCTCPIGHNCKHAVAALIHAGRPEIRARLVLAYPGDQKAAEELSPGLLIWMNDLVVAQAGAEEDYPSDIHQRLFYILKPLPGRNPQIDDLGVETVSVRLLKDGRLSTGATSYSPSSLDDRGMVGTKFLRPSDREILPRLARVAQRASGVGRAVRLTGAEGTGLLTAILATGRARWNEVTGPEMHKAEPITGAIAWVLNPDGSQSPKLEIPPDCLPIRLAPPWCIAPLTGRAQIVQTGLTDRVADTMLGAPSVPAEQTDALRVRLARDVPAVASHAPPVLAPPERLAAPMVPVLRIDSRKRQPGSITPYRGYQAPDPDYKFAYLRFRYGDFELGTHDSRPLPRFSDGTTVVEVIRDIPAETAAVRALKTIGFTTHGTSQHYASSDQELTLPSPTGNTESDWLDFFYRDAPALRTKGWVIVCADHFPIRLVEDDDAAITAVIEDGDGADGRTDWFELDLGVMIDGQRIDLLPALIDLIRSDAWSPDDLAHPDPVETPFFLKLDDGRVLAVGRSRLMPIVRAIHDLLAAKDYDRGAKWRLSAYDAALLAALEGGAGAGVAWSGGEPLRRLGRMLGETGSIPQAVVPPGFAAELRPYQARGVDWLQFLREGGLAGILADEMGLGKTVQALAHIMIEQAAGRLTTPALIVAPTSVVVNWQREAARFAPSLRVLVLQGPDRAQRFDAIPDHDVVISTYPLLARDHAVLHGQAWHMVILDEAQVIKNPNALTSRLMRGLQTGHRLCLTGTPLENNLGELWSLFAFLAPDLLGDRKHFQRRWRTPIEKNGDSERQALLARYVRPFLLRRTKAVVAAELPPKTEIVESVAMEPAQRNLYEGIRLAMHGKVREAIAAKGLARSHIVILEALLRLRQTCCDPRLLKLPAAKTSGVASAKLERLQEMVPELVADGRRILIFSQFTSMLALIEVMLDEAKLRWVKLTGDTRDRQTPIGQFQAGAVPIFLISLKAGGVGLNLTAADTVIHYDPWWNPAVEDQATDRAHRIGQPNPVFVHRLVVAGSVEEKMEALKLRKRQLAEGLFDGQAGDTLAFREADIDELFS